VGAVTAMLDGIVNVTRRVVPTTVATAVAFVVVIAPLAAGCKATSVLAGKIVPAGKFDPVITMLVTPACPAAGAAAGASVTCACAVPQPAMAENTNNRIRRAKNKKSPPSAIGHGPVPVNSYQGRQGDAEQQKASWLGHPGREVPRNADEGEIGARHQ